MYVDHRLTIEELCATLGISRATCYRYVALARRAVAEG
jgi:predicted DNA-binding transcriptional regulator AlpA